jgi:hypothetical protein
MGMDRHKVSADTKNGPETDTHGLAPSSLFQNLAPTTSSGNFVVICACGCCLSSELTQDRVSSRIC